MGITASQLTGKIVIEGADQAKTVLLGMSDNSKKAQADLAQLQKAAQDAGSILANRFTSELKNAQGGLQDLSKRASDAGLDVSKLSSLQQKASEAAAKLGMAQAQAANATEKTNAITNEGSASAEKIALAQARAAVAAENVRKAELAAGDAMSMVAGESTRLADAMGMMQAKGGLFSSVMGGMKERASGFFGAIAEAPGKLMAATQEIGFFVFGVQQIIQAGQQAAGVFVELGKKAGDFQSGITSLKTGAGELQSNLGMVSDGILKLAPEVGTTTKELTDGMFMVEGAGQRGAQALDTLKDAAEGARVQNASLADVAKGVTTEMTDYITQNISAAQATNTLVAEVKLGQSHMEDMSKALVNVLPDAAKVGVSLTDVSAAMATMTQQGTPAANAATFLRQMLIALDAPSTKAVKTLNEIGLTSSQVSDEMKVSLPGALQLITDHLKNKFPEGSAAYVSALKDIAGGSRQMQGMMLLTGASLQTFKDDVAGITEAVNTGGKSITGWSDVQKDFNFQMDRAQEGAEVLRIKLGTALFPTFTQVFSWVASTAIPSLNTFSDWFFDKGVPALQHFVAPLQTVGHQFADFVGHGQAAIPILAGIGAVIAAVLVPAVWSLASGVIVATWPFLAIGLAVGGLTAIFLHFYNTSAGFRDFIAGIGVVLQQVGSFIASQFTPVWKQLQEVWSHQLLPSLQEVWSSLKQLQPELTLVGAILGGALLAAVGLLVGGLGGLVGAIGGMAHGLAEVFSGMAQGALGFMQIVTGVVGFIVDLFTGHFDKLKGDIGVILGGIGQVFTGFGTTLKGIVDTIVGGVTGGFKGMTTSVVGYLNDLVHGVDDKTQKASIASQLHTAEMKDKSIANVQKMSEENWTKFQNMRAGIEDQLAKTTDAADRHTLEMKLKVVQNAQETSQATYSKFLDMRYKSQEQIDLLKQGIDTSMMSAADKAKYHSLNMKQFYLDGVIAMDNESIAKVDHMRIGILDELSKTTDGAKKHSLETQLTQVKSAEDTAKKVKDTHVKMRTDTESEMDKLKKSTADKSNSMYKDIQNIFGGIGKWFTDRWHDVQGAFGATGQWFHDRWSEAWAGTTAFFGGIGKWFGDRWHDTQAVFGSIGAWFHDRWQEAWNGTTAFFGTIGKWFSDRYQDVKNVFIGVGAWFHDRGAEIWSGITSFFGTIGKWFSDRWNEIMASTKPFRDYMGAVFETIWNILVALWGKLGNWFHDRFTEAYNKIVEVFGPIGAWFQARWHDVQVIFGAIGNWFHDRWTEAYNATTSAFGAIGKWFGDRYHDIQVIFGTVGNWFHDRWQEAWNATTATFASIGKWFADRWHDTQNVFIGVGAWFHDRWTEAWNFTTAVFGNIGKWFSDRWTDIQRIFTGIGGWFHDRFTEAWNKIVAVFTPIGKWFTDRWNEVMGGINTFKDGVIAKFNQIKTDVSNIFRGMINGIIDQLNNGIQAFAGFINFFAQKLDDLATSLGTKGTIPMVSFKPIPHYAQGTDSHPGGPAIVGEEGPELVFLPRGAKVAPNNVTEALLAMSGGKVPAYANGIGDLTSSVLNWIGGGAKGILDNLMNMFHITVPKILGLNDIASGMFNKVKDWAVGWIDKILPDFSFGQAVDVPGTVKDWIAQAMALTSTPASWAGALATIAMKESGGNPAAINLTDSNAKAGHPSQGLFQTIPSTFLAHALAGHMNILNPVDNAAAAIGYIKGRYGDVFHVPGIVAMSHGGAYVGYANGGIINERIEGIGLKTGTRYAFGEYGRELVTPYVPSGVNLSSLPVSNSSSTHQEIHIHNYIDGKEIADHTANRIIRSSRSSGPIRS